MAGTYGFHQRTKPRLRVRRGWHGNEPYAISESLPPKADENIKSGMTIIRTVDGTDVVYVKATKALLAQANAAPPAFAYHDATDPDVTSSGLLLGLSSAGKYEIETAYFDSGTYNGGTLLSASTTAGNLKARAATETAVGVVLRGKVNYGGSSDDPNNAHNSEADPATFDGYMLSFVTHWQPIIA